MMKVLNRSKFTNVLSKWKSDAKIYGCNETRYAASKDYSLAAHNKIKKDILLQCINDLMEVLKTK